MDSGATQTRMFHQIAVLDRITMLKYAIPDPRDMFNADLHWRADWGTEARRDVGFS